MALVAAKLADERPDEVALRDDHVALSWAEVNDTLNRVANGLHALDLGPSRPGRRVRRERRRDRARPPRRPARRRLDRAGQLPPQRRRGRLHPAGLRRPGAVRRPADAGDRPRGGRARRASPTVIGWRVPEHRRASTPWEAWLAAADPGEPPIDVAPRPNLHVHVGHDGPAEGRRAAAHDVRRRQDDRRAHRGAGQERLRQVRHAPRGRADVPHRPAVGRPAAGRRRPGRGARALRRRGRAAGHRHATRPRRSVMVPTHFVRLLALPDDVQGQATTSAR